MNIAYSIIGNNKTCNFAVVVTDAQWILLLVGYLWLYYKLKQNTEKWLSGVLVIRHQHKRVRSFWVIIH